MKPIKTLLFIFLITLLSCSAFGVGQFWVTPTADNSNSKSIAQFSPFYTNTSLLDGMEDELNQSINSTTNALFYPIDADIYNDMILFNSDTLELNLYFYNTDSNDYQFSDNQNITGTFRDYIIYTYNSTDYLTVLTDTNMQTFIINQNGTFDLFDDFNSLGSNVGYDIKCGLTNLGTDIVCPYVTGWGASVTYLTAYNPIDQYKYNSIALETANNLKPHYSSDVILTNDDSIFIKARNYGPRSIQKINVTPTALSVIYKQTILTFNADPSITSIVKVGDHVCETFYTGNGDDSRVICVDADSDTYSQTLSFGLPTTYQYRSLYLNAIDRDGEELLLIKFNDRQSSGEIQRNRFYIYNQLMSQIYTQTFSTGVGSITYDNFYKGNVASGYFFNNDKVALTSFPDMISDNVYYVWNETTDVFDEFVYTDYLTTPTLISKRISFDSLDNKNQIMVMTTSGYYSTQELHGSSPIPPRGLYEPTYNENGFSNLYGGLYGWYQSPTCINTSITIQAIECTAANNFTDCSYFNDDGGNERLVITSGGNTFIGNYSSDNPNVTVTLTNEGTFSFIGTIEADNSNNTISSNQIDINVIDGINGTTCNIPSTEYDKPIDREQATGSGVAGLDDFFNELFGTGFSKFKFMIGSSLFCLFALIIGIVGIKGLIAMVMLSMGAGFVFLMGLFPSYMILVVIITCLAYGTMSKTFGGHEE